MFRFRRRWTRVQMIACVLVVDSLGPGPDAELRQASRRRPPLDGVRARRRRAGARSHRQFDTAEEQSDEAGTKPSAAALRFSSNFGLVYIYQHRTRRGSCKLIWSWASPPAQRTWTETFATTRRRGAPHLDMSAAGSLVCLLSVAGGAWSDALTLRPVRDVAT